MSAQASPGHVRAGRRVDARGAAARGCSSERLRELVDRLLAPGGLQGTRLTDAGVTAART